MQSTGTIKNMQTAAMRLSKMMSSPVVASGRLSVRPALMPRSLHISAVLSASRASRTQRTSSKSRAASPAKTAASPDSAQSSKIQGVMLSLRSDHSQSGSCYSANSTCTLSAVLPFTMTPPRALHHAGAVTVQALSKLRTSHSHPIYMKAWSLLQVRPLRPLMSTDLNLAHTEDMFHTYPTGTTRLATLTSQANISKRPALAGMLLPSQPYRRT